jgi:hypothetical protein
MQPLDGAGCDSNVDRNNFSSNDKFDEELIAVVPFFTTREYAPSLLDSSVVKKMDIRIYLSKE